LSIITILHLSDIHFKKKKDENKKIFREQVRGGMIEAIKNHLTTREKGIDFVAVTGDIAFSGKEYQEAQSFFRDLKKVLPKNIRFLVVPGNHDVDRSRIVEIFPIYENIIQKDIIEDFLGNKEHVKNFVNVKFRDFIKFAKELNPSLYNSKEDYFWVANFADEGVSFLGLNSCWASKDDSDRYKIALGYPQLIKALGQSTQKNKILLMHHPLYNWFYEKDFEECENVIFRNCSLVLHGHTHRDNAKALNDPDSSCIYLGVKASYTQVEDGYIGFQFIQAEFREERTTVNVWPYRFSKEPCVRFVPDNHRWESQEGKAYFEISSGRLSIPHEEESKERGSGEEPESFEFPKRIDKSLVIPSEYK
jgi:3',5'-cyclic AMP phosphodiesterase CpdA